MGTKDGRIVSVTIKPFDGLFAELEKGLQATSRGRRGAGEYLQAIGLVRSSIERLRGPGIKQIHKAEGEVQFFRNVWPHFYSRLLLFTWLYKMELNRSLFARNDWLALIEREERRAAAFFRRHREFWREYRSGSVLIDAQFTRAYSQGTLFDPLALIVDPEFATLASLRAAQGLAYEEYLGLLRGEFGMMMDESEEMGAERPGYEFDGTDAEGQEWLMELFASKMIRKKGGEHLNMSEMNRWFKANFGREFSKLFDKMNVLRNRKVDPLRFLHKRMRAMEQWMGERNGRR